jgi:hypothetical protein
MGADRSIIALPDEEGEGDPVENGQRVHGPSLPRIGRFGMPAAPQHAARHPPPLW